MLKHKKRLRQCPKCKERSIIVRCYTRKKDGIRNRVEYCLNKGCGYRKDLPFGYQLLAEAVNRGGLKRV